MIADMPRDRSYLQRRAGLAVRLLARELRSSLEKVHDFVSVDPQTILDEAVQRGLDVDSIEALATTPLSKRDALATTFIQTAKIWSVGEGASLGAAGLVSLPADVVALVATNLRMIQSIAGAYGIRLDNPNGRIEAWLPVLQVLEAEPAPKSWYLGPRRPPRKALQTVVGEVARTLSARLIRHERARAVPLVGAVVSGVSNYAFTSEVAVSARAHFRKRAEQLEADARNVAKKTRKKTSKKKTPKKAKKKASKPKSRSKSKSTSKSKKTTGASPAAKSERADPAPRAAAIGGRRRT